MFLKDKAVLVSLSISQWTARKYDKKVTQQVSESYGVGLGSDVGRYNKKLLPIDTYLKDVHRKSSTVRNKFYDNTLSWIVDGTQMLPNKNYMEFMADFRREKAEWQYLVDSFLDEYPRMKLEAQRLLPNGLYCEDDYPSVDDLRQKFKMDMFVAPLPDTENFFTTLIDSEVDKIRQDVTKRVTETQSAAMKEVWQRLYKRVQHMVEKLDDPSAIFRDSMVENAKETCALLTRLNFIDDPNLEAMRQEVEQKLANQNPDALRLDPVFRATKADEAKAIMSKMDAFMGGL